MVSGMVVFRIKGENDLTERLLKRLNHRGNLHCVPASLKGKYVIRYVITEILRYFDSFSIWIFLYHFISFYSISLASQLHLHTLQTMTC